MRAVGYREVGQFLAGEFPEEELAERIWKSTWAYARRQRTWLRREKKLEKLTVESLEKSVAWIRKSLKV